MGVALRKESVDRNVWGIRFFPDLFASLSARRAWIEMGLYKGANMARSVALRKESVDRNYTMQIVIIVVDTVALRKESVDRNCYLGYDVPD